LRPPGSIPIGQTFNFQKNIFLKNGAKFFFAAYTDFDRYLTKICFFVPVAEVFSPKRAKVWPKEENNENWQEMASFCLLNITQSNSPRIFIVPVNF
jgi:hypothetical protein